MKPTVHTVGIIMNGVTGRMGTNQHLLRSITAIMKEGGVKISPSEFIMPDPVLVGRDAIKLQKLAEQSGVTAFTTDLDSVLSDPRYQVYFDSQTTGRRAEGVRKAVKAGKHIYCEKPIAVDTTTALELHKLCSDAGLKSGVVQDKLWLPGIVKLRRLIQNDFFGKIISVRGEFGYCFF
jgi:predicted dehydrogenase